MRSQCVLEPWKQDNISRNLGNNGKVGVSLCEILQLTGVCTCVCACASVCMCESNPESVRDAVNTHLLP